MTKVKAVIGANYGDEGKGLMTDYYCSQAKERGENVLVICSNGGGQRGHTVSTEDGKRFVFHHLGSGSFVGADTYFSEHFIVNPMIFFQDYNQFRQMYPVSFEIFMHAACRFSTPYDMMANQIIEQSRGSRRHGSVGVGIWETVRRYRKGPGISIGEMKEYSFKEKKTYLKEVKAYFDRRIYEKVGRYPWQITEWSRVWEQESLIEQYIYDLEDMCRMIPFIQTAELACYETIVIENAQGVLLSANRDGDNKHTTPSDTGAREVASLLKSGLDHFVNDIELCYVSRSYLTKHGAGEFPEECKAEEIACGLYDETNMPNPFQGTLRYGRLKEEELLANIEKDEEDMVDYRYHSCICITHINEYVPHMEVLQGKEVWVSDGKCRNSVRRFGENDVCTGFE